MNIKLEYCESGLKITSDGISLRFHDGEPEDNNLARNFNDCYSIITLVRAAFDAGKRGDELKITEETI